MEIGILEQLNGIKNNISKQKSHLSILTLFRGLTGESAKSRLTPEEQSEFLSGIFMIASEMPNIAMKAEEEDLADFVAECFEYLSELSGELITTEQMPLELYASALFMLGGKNANSFLLADRFKSEPKDDSMTKIDLDIWFYWLWHLFLKKELKYLSEESSRFRSLVENFLYTLKARDKKTNLNNVLIATYAIRLADAFTYYTEMLEKNSAKAIKNLSICLEDILNCAEKIGIGRWVFLAETLKSLIERSMKFSSKRFLRRDAILKESEYRNVLVTCKNPIYELWSSQYEAIKNGLLENPSFCLSLETSAGKTFLAEIKIARTLAEHPECLVFYVAPYNALAKQVQRELQKRLREEPLRYNIKVLTGSYEIPDKQLDGVQDENIIITTPEKLDALLRARKENEEIQALFDRLALVVFDECHIVSSGKRGITYELLITRLKAAFPTVRFLALSAVFSNIETMAEWICDDDEACFQSNWRPTRLHEVVWRKKAKGPVYDNAWVIEDYRRSDKPYEDALRMAMDLQKSYDNVLIMTGTKQHAENLARQIYDKLKLEEGDKTKLTPNEVERLYQTSRFIERETRPGFLLATYIRLGVSFHHSDLPNNIKTQIENLIDQGIIKFVVSTTTLAEGLNFPIRCVILPQLRFWGGEPLSPTIVKNIKGRAGRAFKSTSGQAILLPEGKEGQIYYHDKWYSAYELYFKTPKELLEIKSSISKIMSEQNTLDYRVSVDTLDSGILAFLVDGTVPSNDSQAKFMVGKTYIHKMESENAVDNFFEGRMEEMAMGERPALESASPFSVTEFGIVCNKTGYSPLSCNVLADYISRINKSNNGIFDNFDLSEEEPPDNLKHIVAGVFLLPDLIFQSIGLSKNAKDIFGNSRTKLKSELGTFFDYFQDAEKCDRVTGSIMDYDLQIIWDWLSGSDYIEIADRYFRAKNLKKDEIEAQKQQDRALMDAFSYIAFLRNNFRWGFFALRKVAEHLASKEQIDFDEEFLKGFALCIDQGTSSWFAGILMKADFPVTRIESNSLANLADQNIRWSGNFVDGINWLEDIVKSNKGKRLIDSDLRKRISEFSSASYEPILPYEEW